MKKIKPSFAHHFSAWANQASQNQTSDWSEQLRILNEVADLITPQLSLEEIIAAIYENVNRLIDAYQFCVGIYDEKTGMIYYKGMIENGKKFPDFSVDAMDENRLASWCIRNEEDIFMNDFDKEYSRYLRSKPQPLVGMQPKAALYTPLKLNDKVVAFIVVRTIHKNAYSPYHLYILKTVGNFVIRALELAKHSSKPFVKGEKTNKEWRWENAEALSPKSKKILMLLTEREKEVLLYLVTGLPNKAIAKKLFVSDGTIKTHTLNIYQKLDVANRTSAILKAMEWGWVI